jgi:hypothetical protein
MRDQPSLTDLVTRAGNGDTQEWDALVERYAPADLVYLPQAPAGRRRGRPRRPQRLGTASRPAGHNPGSDRTSRLAVTVVAAAMVVRVANEPWRAREELPPIEGSRR